VKYVRDAAGCGVDHGWRRFSFDATVSGASRVAKPFASSVDQSMHRREDPSDLCVFLGISRLSADCNTEMLSQSVASKRRRRKLGKIMFK